MTRRIAALSVAASVTVALGGCAGSNAKSFDISPVFPLSAGKCAKYHGDQKGSGIAASCMVTKDECEKAAADWRTAMQSSGVHDAIMFRCS